MLFFFPVVMYGCESWTIRKSEHWRIHAFELWCWRKLLGVPWTSRSNQWILKEISPENSLKGLMLKLKLHTLSTWCEELYPWKNPWCWEKLKAWGEGDDRGWDGWMTYWLDGYEFEQALGVCDGKGSLACCSPRGCKELDVTEQLNWIEQCCSLYWNVDYLKAKAI